MSRRRWAEAFILSITAVLLSSSAGRGDLGSPAQVRLIDLEGVRVEPLKATDARAIVFLFTRTDCPISNRYAPEVRRIVGRFAPRGIRFYLVYPDPDESVEMIRNHIKEYEYDLRGLRDPEHALVKMTAARVTPEAAVFIPGEKEARMIYRGRIDDRFVEFGKARRAPTTHDLEAVLEAVIKGKPVVRKTTVAIGCFIPDLQ